MSTVKDGDSSLSGLLTMTPGGVVAAGVVMPFLACTAVGLRFYARRWQRLGLEADDWTMLAGALMVGILGLILIVGVAIGALGLHSLPASPGNSKGDTIEQGPADSRAETILRAYNIVEKPTFAVIKISVVLMYRRIFRGGVWCAITIASIAVMSSLAVAFVVTSALQCKRRNWEVQYADWALQHHCVSAELSTFGFAVADVVTDPVVVMMPLPAVWGLKMSVRRKVTVFCVFVLASSSVAVGIIRLAVLAVFTYTPSGPHGYRDLLGVMSTVPTMSIVEAGIAIVAACTPTFRHLITSKVLNLSSDPGSSSKGTTYAASSSGKRIYLPAKESGNNKKNRTGHELDTLTDDRALLEGDSAGTNPLQEQN